MGFSSKCIKNVKITYYSGGSNVVLYFLDTGTRSAVGSASDSRARSPGFVTRSSHVLVTPSSDSRRAIVRYWRKYVHEVLVNRLGLPRKSVVRLTDRPDMTKAVYRGRKTTKKQLFT